MKPAVTAPIDEFLAGIVPAKRRSDAARLLDLMSRVTGEPPELLYGKAIGFGRYHSA